MEQTPSQNLSSYLLQIEAVKLELNNPFTWASGLRSPIYCDNRISLSYPKIRNYIKEQLIKTSKSFSNFDTVAGVATAGIPHGMLLADAIEHPFIYVRSKSKEHGRKNMIEGALKEGSKVLVVEDLISTGKSSIAAIQALQDAGAEVIGALAIFTYGFDQAVQNFKDINVPFITLTNYDLLIERALETNYINEDQKILLAKWRENPKEWYDQNFN